MRAELATREQASALCLRPVFGFDWSDVAEVHDPGGVVAFGLPDGATGAAWLFVPTKPPEKTPACLVAAGRYFDRAQYKREGAEYQGSKLAIYRRSTVADANASSIESTAVLFRTSDVYGVANSQAAAEAVLRGAAIPSGQPATTDDPGGGWLLDNAKSDGNVSLLIRPFPLWESLAHEADDAADQKDAPAATESPTARASVWAMPL